MWPNGLAQGCDRVSRKHGKPVPAVGRRACGTPLTRNAIGCGAPLLHEEASLQPYGAIAWSGMFTSGTTTWVPDIEIGYRYQAHRDNPAVALTAQDGTLFMVPGTQVGRSMATVKARVTALVGGAWSVYVNYGGYFANHLHDNALSVGFSKRF